MGRLGRATCTVYLISAPDLPGGKIMYHYIWEAKSLLSKYVYCEPQHAVEEDECWQNQRQIYACNTDSNARQEVMKVSETGLNLLYIFREFLDGDYTIRHTKVSHFK